MCTYHLLTYLWLKRRGSHLALAHKAWIEKVIETLRDKEDVH